MYQVYNTQTNEAMPVLSETPYELAGPLAERIIEQKRDEQGNLLYLKTVELAVEHEDAEPTYEMAEVETTEPYHTYERERWSEEEQDYVVEVDTAPNPPVMVDAGALYEWREIVPTLKEAQDAKWVEIKNAREIEQYKPLLFNELLFDFDAKSQSALSAAIQTAQASLLLSVPLPEIEWTLANNSKTLLTTNQLMQLLFTGVSRTNSIFSYARELREEIYKDDATVESVNNVVWSYGGVL